MTVNDGSWWGDMSKLVTGLVLKYVKGWKVENKKGNKLGLVSARTRNKTDLAGDSTPAPAGQQQQPSNIKRQNERQRQRARRRKGSLPREPHYRLENEQ
jgi:hypothetical protein